MLATKEEVRAEARHQILELLNENGNSPTKVGRILNVNKGLVSRVRDGGYSEIVTVALGLPVIKTTEVAICLECGHLHSQKKTCTPILKKTYQKRRRKAIDLEPGDYGKMQSDALDDLARDAGCKSWTEYCVRLADDRIAQEERLAESESELFGWRWR